MNCYFQPFLAGQVKVRQWKRDNQVEWRQWQWRYYTQTDSNDDDDDGDDDGDDDDDENNFRRVIHPKLE